MLNNWLLLAFPIAVSQLTVFWLVLTQRFTIALPAQCVEMVTPILAAFLGAHLLSAEYRSRVGAILATRPIHIGRIVLMRLFCMLALVWGLALLSLLAFRGMMKPFDILPDFLACIPSTLALTMVSLTFATVFRNSIAGFGVAAIYWALDLIPGAAIQPYLSLKTLSSYYAVELDPAHQTFLTKWWITKLILLAVAALLYAVHGRLVLLVGSPLTLRIRKQASLFAGVGLILYIVSGAVLKVSYGYTHRGQLPRGDLEWFRYQIAPFGPMPVASLFGTSFRHYLGDIDNPWHLPSTEEGDLLGDTETHRRHMHEVLDSSPQSIWAQNAADALATLEVRGKKPDEIVTYYRDLLKRFPSGPYELKFILAIARTYSDMGKEDEARTAYSDLLSHHATGKYQSEAYRYLCESQTRAKAYKEAQQWAEKWSDVAPVEEKFEALMDVMQLRRQNGDSAGADKAAKEMLDAIAAFREAVKSESVELSPKQENTLGELAARAERSVKAH